MTKSEEIRYLIDVLNKHRNKYFNEATPEISDAEYDAIFDKLKLLEEETGLIYPDSPSVNVGYQVVSKLSKVTHNHPMLSLGKTKDVNDVVSFIGNSPSIAMLKMDGLTVSLLYEDGVLVRAETRGDGYVGEDVTHNAFCINNVPQKISLFGRVIIDGEVISTYKNFDRVNSKLPKDEIYKHVRNYASGSLRQLDAAITKNRGLSFIAWRLISSTSDENAYVLSDSFSENLDKMASVGFTVVPYKQIPGRTPKEELTALIDSLKNEAEKMSYPIDGIVFGYNSVKKIAEMGKTEHHLRGEIAFKFANDLYESTLRRIEWNVGRNDMITPVAVFDPINMDDGTTVERASLHNLSIIKSLGLRNNCTVYVAKMNEIIPQVQSCLDDGDGDIIIPDRCPSCGAKTEITGNNQSEFLTCVNPNCSGKIIGKLCNFVSKPALNIDGLSEATLTTFYNKGWLNCFEDIYKIPLHRKEIVLMPGLGLKSYNNLVEALEKSKNVSLDKFIVGLCIPGIGKAAAKTISEAVNGDWELFYNKVKSGYNFSSLKDIGPTVNASIREWASLNIDRINEFSKMFTFSSSKKPTVSADTVFSGKTIVVTGTLKHFTRDSIEEKIISVGGKTSGSVSKKTDYLLTNDKDSGSSKAVKAKELGVKIISEQDFLDMLKD